MMRRPAGVALGGRACADGGVGDDNAHVVTTTTPVLQPHHILTKELR
jgi:hypothetical protein